MQVTELTPQTMQIRMLVSASNAGRAFDLRCEVREKMITFLQAEYPHALPRGRAEIDGARVEDDMPGPRRAAAAQAAG
jgi:hypothetical protein